MRQEQVDLAVVGCGVSGAAAALAAAQRGISVSILEEHSKVGEPSHCSGHVGILAFEQFAPKTPRRIIENEIKGAVLYPPSEKPLTLKRATPITWVLNRAEFDKHLSYVATKAGAHLYTNSRVVSFRRLDRGFRVETAGLKPTDISCRVLIDASGFGASVSKYAGLSQAGPRMLVNSAQFSVDQVTDVDEDFVELYFGQHYAPGFFGWIIPRRDGSAKVGIAAGARANVRQCFERFVGKHPVVSKKLKHAHRLTKTVFHPIPVDGATRRTYADGMLSVGDAASQVKPTTGGGIVFGLACGRLAGMTAANAVISDDTSEQFLGSYEKSWRQLIGFDLKAMSWLRRLLYTLPDQYLDRIFKISNELRVDELLRKSSDIDFQGRTLVSLARDPRLFITLLSASVLSAPSLLTTESPER